MGNTRKSDNTKRAAGIARKAEAADQKAAQQAARDEADEEERWQKGTKGSNKKYVFSPFITPAPLALPPARERRG